MSQIEADALRAAVRDALRDELRAARLPERENLTAEEAAGFLGVSVRTLEGLVADGTIRPNRVRPRLRRFQVAHLRAVLDAHTR